MSAMSEQDLRELIRQHEVVAVKFKGSVLVVYDSLFAYAKRLVKEARA